MSDVVMSAQRVSHVVCDSQPDVCKGESGHGARDEHVARRLFVF